MAAADAAHAGPGEAFNRFGHALACPVTRASAFARGRACTVPLAAGLANDGVVLCNQVPRVNWKARRVQLIDAVPPGLAADVLARVATLID